MTIESRLVDLDDIKVAAERLSGQAVKTPLVESAYLNEVVGGRVFLKCENLQRTGSFKFRGAFNALSLMTEEERQKGVVAVSSGNHAQGIAEAARLFGVKATIVMPADAPALKTARVKRSGASIVPYDRYTEDREAIARELASTSGAQFVHPFNDPKVIAGQGTAGLETLDQLPKGVVPGVGLICCGGGGLCAGVSTVWRDAFPKADLVAIEPDDFDDTARSFEAGYPVPNRPGKRSICDAILTEQPGDVTFAINTRNGVRALSVGDDEVLAAMRFALQELKMVVEPGGVVCLAALLAKKVDVSSKTVLAVLSGGNTDGEMIERALSKAV